MRRHNNNSGFTLIELSIVLMIIGILVGLGANMIGPLTNFVKVRETRETMDANLQAVISWASSHNAIPGSSEFQTASRSPLDAWGRSFAYLHYSSLSRSPSTKDTICGRRSTPLSLHTTDPEATINNVAFALLSGAENIVFKSSNGPGITVSRDATGIINVIGPNSDLVRWVTLDELRSKIGCQGAPLKILNNELPYGTAGDASYLATITTDGGIPFTTAPNPHFEWCIEKPASITLPFTSNGGVTIQDPLGCTGAAWTPVADLIFSGLGTGTQKSYSFTVYVRDSDNNTAQKSFVITVNP